jgi:hypothetical protein
MAAGMSEINPTLDRSNLLTLGITFFNKNRVICHNIKKKTIRVKSKKLGIIQVSSNDGKLILIIFSG